MSDIQDKDDELSDIVLLPYDFPLLNPPPFVIDFLKSVDERLLDSRFNFPLDALRDLYKKDKYLFSKIKFFLFTAVIFILRNLLPSFLTM